MAEVLGVRELQPADIPLVVEYWLDSDPAFLRAMGVDRTRLPTHAQMTATLQEQLVLPIPERTSYCLVWLADGNPIGHCNTNPTVFGEQGWMHLHIWRPGARRRGSGAKLLDLTLPRLFEDLQLQRLYSEPYALNPAPHAALARAGFEFVKQHTTVPGVINFEQPVKRWVMTRERLAARSRPAG